VTAYIRFADKLSAWFGHAFGWLIVTMTFGTSYEVVVRYLFNAPTPWSFDVSFIMYGGMFMMAGAYTLSRNGHVRGDFVYRAWPPRRQARFDLVLYVCFFFPGVLALIISGWKYAARSWGYGEVSINSPAGIPVFQLKAVIVAAGLLLFMQGIAQVFRCILCIRDGYWIGLEEDVRETDEILIEAAQHGEDPRRLVE
jgi:TRAP-type mannitol/chloroaromatic compound transport system permease small subunit